MSLSPLNWLGMSIQKSTHVHSGATVTANSAFLMQSLYPHLFIYFVSQMHLWLWYAITDKGQCWRQLAHIQRACQRQLTEFFCGYLIKSKFSRYHLVGFLYESFFCNPLYIALDSLNPNICMGSCEFHLKKTKHTTVLICALIWNHRLWNNVCTFATFFNE